MPDIPFSPRASVAPSGASGVFLGVERNPNAFGASVATATQQVGSTLDRAAEQTAQTLQTFQKEYNETGADQLNTSFDAMARQKHGEYKDLRGQAAMDARDDTIQQIEQMRMDVRGQASNPQQAKLFDYMSRKAAKGYLDSVDNHARTEFKVWQGDTAVGVITNEVNRSQDFAPNSPEFASSLGNIKIQTDKLSALKGIDPNSDYGKAQVAHYQGEAWSATLTSIMAHDANLARDVFDANADQIDAKHRASLDAQITSHQWTQTMRETAQAQREDAQAQKQLHIAQTATEADMMGRAVSGKPPSRSELAEALRTQTITPTAYHSIIAVQRGNADAPSDPRLLATFYSRIGDPANPLQKDEVLRAAGNGLHGSAAASLMMALNAQGRREEKPEERGYYDQLKIALGGHNVEKGIVDLSNEAGRKQSQLWAQAQGEWTQRVTVNGESPSTVVTDMLGRYQVNPVVPANWPAPRMGAVTSMEDVQRVAAATKDAAAKGSMNEAQATEQAQLLVRYAKFYQDQKDRQVAAAAAGRKSAAQPGSSGKAKVKGLVAQDQ